MPKVTACSTLSFSLSSLEAALEHIAGYGFERVEISDQLTHSKHFSTDVSRAVDPEHVRRLFEKHSLSPIAANCTLATFHDGRTEFKRRPVPRQSAAETEEIRRAKKDVVIYQLDDRIQATAYRSRARKLIDNAVVAGIPLVCLEGGCRVAPRDQPRVLKAAAEVIDDMAEYAGKVGVRIMLEMPHVWQVYCDEDRSREMLSYLNSGNVGVLVDSTHWHTSHYDIDDYVRFLGDRLWHVHLRDAAGKDSPAGDYQLEKTPGRGEVDFGLLGDTLDKYGYGGHVTLETEYKNYRDIAEVDVENRYALAHLKKVGWEVPEAG